METSELCPSSGDSLSVRIPACTRVWEEPHRPPVDPPGVRARRHQPRVCTLSAVLMQHWELLKRSRDVRLLLILQLLS